MPDDRKPARKPKFKAPKEVAPPAPTPPPPLVNRTRVELQDCIARHRRVIASGTRYGLAEFDEFCEEFLRAAMT